MSHLKSQTTVVSYKLHKVIKNSFILERLVTSVLPHVHLNHGLSGALMVTDLANVRPQLTVDGLHVLFQALGVSKILFAQVALFLHEPARHVLLRLVQMCDGMVAKLGQLLEAFVANRADIFPRI